MNTNIDVAFECKRIFQNALRFSKQLAELQTDSDSREGAAISARSLGGGQAPSETKPLLRDAQGSSSDAIGAITLKAAAAVLCNSERIADQLEALAKHKKGKSSSAATSDDASPNNWRGARWTQDEIAIVLAHCKGLEPRGPQHMDLLLQKLGWDRSSAHRARKKLCAVRNILERGGDPFSGKHLSRAKRYTYNWRVCKSGLVWDDIGQLGVRLLDPEGWLKAAFVARPDFEATADEIAAYLEADPMISPKLDRRIEPTQARLVPLWRKAMQSGLTQLSGFANTGRKRNGRVIYRYEPPATDVREEGQTKPKARQRGKKGVLPKKG